MDNELQLNLPHAYVALSAARQAQELANDAMHRIAEAYDGPTPAPVIEAVKATGAMVRHLEALISEYEQGE